MLDLEDAIGRAELIVAVRLVDVSESKVVHGGKTEVITQQFKFEPVRTLKGIFARDSLLLTGQDLGIYQYGDAADKLERGSLVLLLLGRQGPGYFNCNPSGSFEQSIPRLKALTDPLLPAVEALIAVTQKRDRAAKVSVLLAALDRSSDRAAVPLLISLRRRSLIAAQTPGAMAAVGRLLGDPSATVREASASTLAALLDADYLDQADAREAAVKAIVPALESKDRDLGAKVAELDALGAVGASALKVGGALEWLRADRPASTFAESAARLRAIGLSGRKDQARGVVEYLGVLPLDAPPEIQLSAAQALVRLDPQAAVTGLLAKISEKSDRGLGLASEIGLIGELPKEIAAPALLEAFGRVEAHADRLAFAMACVKVADARLVPSLGTLLDPRYSDVRYYATESLRKIDTDEAASVAWPHLAIEPDLGRKLQLAEFLGRHGFRGGYPYAIEHMSSLQLQDAAVNALAAIREPKSVPELRKIWESSNDLAWNASAIRALGKLGQGDIAPRLLEVASDLKNPLAPPALIALGDLNEPKALPIVEQALNSRNDLVVIAATRAARTLLAHRPKVEAGQAPGDRARQRLSTLLGDSDSSLEVRLAALETLAELDEAAWLGPALGAAVLDGQSERSPLLLQVESLLTRRKQPLILK